MNIVAQSATVVAIGHKAPEAVEFVVNDRFAEFSIYSDGQLANLRYEPFDESAPWAWQRGWLDGEHCRCIPEGDDPADYEPQRKALYARYNVRMVGAR